MTFEDYLAQLGYTLGENGKYRDSEGQSVSEQALGQVQDNFNQFNQVDAQGRPLYGTKAYVPGTGDAPTGLYRIGDPTQWQTDPRLQQILQQSGGSLQYDPTYGYTIPGSALEKWKQTYSPDAWYEAGLGPWGLAAAAFGGAALSGISAGAGAAEGAGAVGGSLPDSYWSMLADSGGGVSDALGSGAGSLGGGNMDLLDWINSNWDSVVPSQTDLGSFSSDMFGAGDISPDWWGGLDPSNGWGVDELGGNIPWQDAVGGVDPNSSSWLNSLKNLFGGSGGTGVNLGGLLGGGGIGDLLSKGLAVAPSLAAINYARNQTPFDTSKLESIYGQYSPSGQTFQYDQASGAGRGQLASNLERRGIMGSSFGDQSIANYDTTRTLGRNALLNQGATTQANIANSIIAAQAKDRELKNTLYGSALYALAGGLAPRSRV